MTAVVPPSARLEVGPTGIPIIVKRAEDPRGRRRLHAEVAVLQRLGHPRLVQIVDFADDAGGTEVRLAWVGPHSLGTVGPLDVSVTGAIVADVANIVADLHDAGFGHGRLTAEHVLVAADGHPVLTGMADAGPLDRVRPADDVAAVGALLSRLAVASAEDQAIPDRRPRRRDAGLRGVLLTLADQAQSDDECTRPSARALAASLRTATPDHRSGRRPRPTEARSTPPPVIPGRDPSTIWPKGRRMIPAFVALAAVVLAASWWLARQDPADDAASRDRATSRPLAPGAERPVPATAPPPPAAAPTTVLPPATTVPPVIEPAPPGGTPTRCPPVGGAASADIDGDGCPEAITITGPVVNAAGVAWRVGRDGDQVVVGDWDCDGRATAASLRPSTGDVFVFTRWAADAESLTVTAAERVVGAVRLVTADDDGDGCASLSVTQTGGGSVPIPVRRAS